MSKSATIKEVESWDEQRTLNAFLKIVHHARASIENKGANEADAIILLDAVETELHESAKERNLVVL